MTINMVFSRLGIYGGMESNRPVNGGKIPKKNRCFGFKWVTFFLSIGIVMSIIEIPLKILFTNVLYLK